MEEIIKKVKEFNEIGGQPVNLELTNLDEDSIKLKLDILTEEFLEFKSAFEKQDHIEERDAIGDIIYVLIGIAHARGYAKELISDLDTIHENNMSKFCEDEEEAKYTEAKYKKTGILCNRIYMEKYNKWVVIRDDGKVLKSVSHRKVKLV